MKHHTNIVLDPLSHLERVDHIVNDLSHEIVHRCQNSPHKHLKTSEANQVEMMEGFGKRTITLSKSTKNLKPVNENEELDTVNENSDWKRKTKIIQRRSRGWISRFQQDMRQGGRVRPPPEQESEDQGDLLLRSQAFHAVALASSVGAEKRQQRPVQPRMHAVSDLQPFSNRLLQSSLCVVCFAIVGIDLERMSCEHCPVVAHR
jgi:hypothetical protein